MCAIGNFAVKVQMLAEANSVLHPPGKKIQTPGRILSWLLTMKIGVG
jgi:hypothetical protein